MYEQDRQQPEVKAAEAQRSSLGRVIAVGTIVLWLVTMLLLLGPAALHSLF